MKFVGCLLLVLLLKLADANSGGVDITSCDLLDCDICCKPGNPAVCLNDTTALNCIMKRDPDQHSLLVILLLLLGFLIGLPILRMMVYCLINHKLSCCSMSVCEFVANTCCWCCCMNRKKQRQRQKEIKQEHRDMEENDVLQLEKNPKGKQRRTKKENPKTKQEKDQSGEQPKGIEMSYQKLLFADAESSKSPLSP